MMPRSDLRVLVDLDGVIADLMTAWQEWHQWNCPQRGNGFGLGPCCDLRDTTMWHLENFASCSQAVYGFFDTSVYDKVLPIPGAVEGVLALLKTPGIDLWVVSNVPPGHPEHYGLKLKWLDATFGGMLNTRFVVAQHDKSGVLGDVLVDDNPTNLVIWPGPYKILFNQPWNVARVGRWMSRAAGWPNVVERVLWLLNLKRENSTTSVMRNAAASPAQSP